VHFILSCVVYLYSSFGNHRCAATFRLDARKHHSEAVIHDKLRSELFTRSAGPESLHWASYRERSLNYLFISTISIRSQQHAFKRTWFPFDLKGPCRADRAAGCAMRSALRGLFGPSTEEGPSPRAHATGTGTGRSTSSSTSPSSSTGAARQSRNHFSRVSLDDRSASHSPSLSPHHHLSPSPPPSPATPNSPAQHGAGYFPDLTPSASKPIQIATPGPNSSSSPQLITSEVSLSFGEVQFTEAHSDIDIDFNDDIDMTTGPSVDTPGRGRQDSFVSAGPKPISGANPHRDSRQRRESLAGSMMGGMSWGGVSVSSFIRDE